MTPDEEVAERRVATWTERHWKKASVIAGIIVVFATCTGATLSWMGINLGDIGPAAKFRTIEASIESLTTGQDTIAKRVVAVERSMNILATMLCTTPGRPGGPPRDARAQRQCDRFLLELEEEP